MRQVEGKRGADLAASAFPLSHRGESAVWFATQAHLDGSAPGNLVAPPEVLIVIWLAARNKD